MSKYRVFSGPYFHAFELNTDRYFLSLRIQSEYGKTQTRKTPYVDTFHSVVGLNQGPSVFKNQSLSSYYKYMWSLCKRLHLKKLIHSFWVSNGNVSLKVRENTPVLLVTHVRDLEKSFQIKGLVGDIKD